MSNVIEVHNLNKSFGSKKAVDNLNLTLKKGEIFGFLGPNGSGKTTTLRMLCGLLVPDAGEGHCLGYDILKESSLIKKQVGYMTQKFSLYEDLTIRENLDFIGRIYQLDRLKQRVNIALENLGLAHRQNQLAGELSGGWKQRLALSAALLHEPQLLLLDEPTAGVDPEARRDFWDQIHHLAAQGITTLVSTHYMDEAERCHKLAYIAFSHLLVQGTLNEIIENTKLVTWQVSGKNLMDLTEKFHHLPGIEQITAFGNTFHICGTDEILMQQSLSPFINDPLFQWEKIRPGLEDIFINLTAIAKRGNNV